jgi:acyl dehydratase
MPRVRPYQGRSFNPVPDVENRIHSDEGARKHGFKGGLVPGVSVSAYLMHPGAETWGDDFAARGAARIVLGHPLYDDRPFSVSVAGPDDPPSENAYGATLLDEDENNCATATVWLADSLGEVPVRRGDPLWSDADRQVRGTRQEMERLREQGMRAVRFPFREGEEMLSYTRDPREMAAPYRPGPRGYANPAFMLGLTNWALAVNVYLDAWLHLQTEHRFFAPVEPGAGLIAESRIVDLFEKKGHEFVDLDVDVFFEDGRAAMTARLRAIYRLRSSRSEP